MKLRNKKTGKVFDVIVREKSNGDGEYSIIVCNLRALRSARSVSSILGEYDTLAKFNKDWEDYKPTEPPLIEDETVRSKLRAFAKREGWKSARYSPVLNAFVNQGDMLFVEPSWELNQLEPLGYVPITKLCGKEAE